MSDRNYWVFSDDNCKFPAMTKEQILTAIQQAVSTGEIKDCDTGFISTVKTINGQPLRFFVGTQSEYELLTSEERYNLFAIITNDTTKESLSNALYNLGKDFEDFKDGILNGDIVVPQARNAYDAENDVNGNKIHETYALKADAFVAKNFHVGSINIGFPFAFEKLPEGKTISDIVGIALEESSTTTGEATYAVSGLRVVRDSGTDLDTGITTDEVLNGTTIMLDGTCVTNNVETGLTLFHRLVKLRIETYRDGEGAKFTIEEFTITSIPNGGSSTMLRLNEEGSHAFSNMYMTVYFK